MNLIFLITTLGCTSAAAQKLTTVLLKQAAEEILKSPLTSEPEAARLEGARATDLLINRLQAELSLRITNNWRSITDPQRWQILESKGAAEEVLRSFLLIRTKVEELEDTINVQELQNTLNEVVLEREDMSQWITFWDNFKRKVGQIAQLYNYFKGYVDNPEGTEDNTLRDFATSITKSTVAGRTMTSMLQDFHQTIVEEKTFPYLRDILAKVNNKVSVIDSRHWIIIFNIDTGLDVLIPGGTLVHGDSVPAAAAL